MVVYFFWWGLFRKKDCCTAKNRRKVFLWAAQKCTTFLLISTFPFFMPALLLGGSGRGYGRCVPMHHPLTKAFCAWKGFGKALSRLLEELEKKGFRRGFILSNFVFLFRSLLILAILSYECKCRTGCLIQFGSKAHAYIHSSESETIYLVNVKHDAEWMHSSLHWFQYRCRFTRRKDIQSWSRNLSLECWVQSSGQRARSSHLSRIRRI